MPNRTQNILLYPILMLTQISILGNVAILGYAVPFLFLYIIIKFSRMNSIAAIMSIGFVTGLIIDIFYNTLGVYTLSTTIVSALRYSIIKLIVGREDGSRNQYPSVKSLGKTEFVIYTIFMVFIFSLIIFVVQAFALFNPLKLTLQVALSSVITTLSILLLDTVCDR